MLEINQIHHGDCLELMHQIPDGSVDMVLADLPYGTTACAWDSIIPLEPLWEHYKRVIKPRGAIVLTASQPFTSMLVMSNLEWFKYSWVWEKTRNSNPYLAKIQPLRVIEDILVFGCKTIIYNPQMQEGENYKINRFSGGRIASSKKANGIGHTTNFISHRYPKNIIKIPNKNIEMGRHETQKPVALFSYLIRTYTNPGDLVLDNTAGSGTTAIAAIDTGRNWLLIEKDPEYYQIAKERINERLKQPFLPGLGAAAHNKSLLPNGDRPEQQSLFNTDEQGEPTK